ncbi:hypothetical protein GCM10011348_28700 [Marinobacterium nitratireducens]|uniref:Sulfatase N-terminal domain-containing protein n=1 Tax=Marinobacterium nitratireducens TaxID=518897 RepID=A0A917ZJC2_9GAMM|nr:sulfatase-like hydrolase/transferase [Marinobacterium nitratireducens]GGO83843.1 hypothetical protein GCM10011348_28700 [Marinobacterium nitratireducens]
MTKPNFIFIMTDTQATNMVGSYCGQNLRTPNIDRLAKEGVKFERGYTTNPLCTPARAGIFTGIYSHSTGSWTNNLSLSDNVKTMGERFRDLGYRTPYVGKWHLEGHDYFGTGEVGRGWESEYWYDGKNYLDNLTEEEITFWRKGGDTLEKLKSRDVKEDFTWGHRISDRGIDFLKNHDGSDPFLLVLSYDEPHHPYTCPPEFVEPFKDFEYDIGPAGNDDLAGKPAHQREWAEAAPCKYDSAQQVGSKVRFPLYFGCNSYVDYEIGRVLAAAERYAPENTYIIYTSDHGEMMGAHQLWGKGSCSYEEITHIPYIIRPPKTEASGTVVNTPVSHIDLLPTMLDLAGADIPPILHGRSLQPLLGKDAEEPNWDVFLEFNRFEIEHDSFGGFKPLRAIVSGDYKLTINLLSTDELYDLKTDPSEMHNLIDSEEHADIRNAMHERLIDWMYEKRDPFRGPEWERRPWQPKRSLRWMGKFRPRPADGYAPVVRDYDTGLPTKGIKVEFESGSPVIE